MEITSFEQLEFIEDILAFSGIMDSDSYKTSHWPQYPPGTQYAVSYLESRGGQFSETVQFGFMYHLKKDFVGRQITNDMIDVAKFVIVEHMGGDPTKFNEAGWRIIANELGGRYPLKIDILPEGYKVGTKNCLARITNTDPRFYWLPNYVETKFLRVWYPITVATLSHEIKKVIREYLEKTGTPSLIDFMLQDFGSRGCTCTEQALIGGMAHLVNFKGTDTMTCLMGVFKYYKGKTMPGFSASASEHSTMTSWGQAHEEDAVENMLDIYQNGIVSIVGDSFDIFNFCENIIGKKLKHKVMNRNGTVVVRPDSSDGVKYTLNGVVLRILKILGDAFGVTVNSKGYKVLPNFIRVLQGDGMNIHSLRSLCRALEEEGWSLDNIVCFGMGGKLLQGVDRDTQKFAFKMCAIDKFGIWYEVFKDPITDPGKSSQRGIPSVTYSPNSGFHTTTTLEEQHQYGERLVNVFLNGDLTYQFTFDEVRENVETDDYSIILSTKNGK